MPTFKDLAAEIDEPNDAPMGFRTKARIKAAIQRAAALSGVDDAAFTINAAYQAAMLTIAAHERTLLQQADRAAFFTALENSPEPTKSLKAAFKRHRATIISK